MQWIKAQLRQGIFGQGWRMAILCLVLLVSGYLISKIYTGLNHGPAVWVPQTPLDTAIPVIPIFIIPYDTLEPLLYLSIGLLMLFRARIFVALALALITTWLVSYVFYIFVQTYIDRPQLTGTDVFT